MELYNQSKEEVIASKVIIAKTFFKRLRGLLGKKGLEIDECMIIYPCKSIHTFFMQFPIDVIFLDKDFRVIKVIRDMKPWSATSYIKEARYVVEMSSSKIRDTNTVEIGDQLELKDNKLKECLDNM